MYGDGGVNQKRKFAPVNEGDEVDVKIESVGEKGDGVAKIKGFVLFIPGAKENEEIRVRINKVLKSVGFAEKIGEAQGPIEISEPRQQEPEAQPELVEEENYEDSEDFGDDSDEESEDTAEKTTEDESFESQAEPKETE